MDIPGVAQTSTVARSRLLPQGRGHSGRVKPPGMPFHDTERVDPMAPLRSVGDRLAPPADALAQRVADRVVELVVAALDVNALLDRVDVDALLDRVDVDRLLNRVDVARLADRVDIDSILGAKSFIFAMRRLRDGCALNEALAKSAGRYNEQEIGLVYAKLTPGSGPNDHPPESARDNASDWLKDN